MTRAAVAVGCDALFLETHPCVEKALCDGANMLPLNRLRDLMVQLKTLDEFIKKQITKPRRTRRARRNDI